MCLSPCFVSNCLLSRHNIALPSMARWTHLAPSPPLRNREDVCPPLVSLLKPLFPFLPTPTAVYLIIFPQQTTEKDRSPSTYGAHAQLAKQHRPQSKSLLPPPLRTLLRLSPRQEPLDLCHGPVRVPHRAVTSTLHSPRMDTDPFAV